MQKIIRESGDEKIEAIKKISDTDEKRLEEKTAGGGIVVNNKKQDVKQLILNFEPKPETDKITDERIVKDISKLGKSALERRTGGRIQPSGLVRSIKDSPAEALKRLDEIIKEKQKDKIPGLIMERDELGRVRFRIVENEQDLDDIDNFDDVNLLNKNKTAIDKILEDEEAKKKYEKPACPNFKSEKCPANKYGDPVKGKVPDEAKKCPNNKDYTCPYLKTGYGYGVKANVQERELIESSLEDIFENSFDEARIYPNQNLIKDVAVISRVSKNNREYSDKALEQIVGLCDGVRVFSDHKVGTERSIRELIGFLKNPRKENNKVIADFEVLKSQDWVINIAVQMPHTAGMSIIGRGKTLQQNGKETVEEVLELRSVDLVSYPATTKGIFEGERKFNEGENPCPHWRTAICIGWNFKEDASLCDYQKTENCPYLGK